MKTYKIYWHDLTEEAKVKLKDLDHENVDLLPLAIIELEGQGLSGGVEVKKDYREGIEELIGMIRAQKGTGPFLRAVTEFIELENAGEELREDHAVERRNHE